MFVDDEGKPLYKAASTVNVESDSEVDVVVTSTSLKGASDSGY
ncbi:hypothetical protein Tco_1396785, partial [Tanacetum coccineum]